LKAALKTSENDLREFKDVYKQYTDQLIRVKVFIHLSYTSLILTLGAQVSDMANNDLEKYAKALDKYVI
jgi:DNA repair protein RAD50